MSSSLVPMVSPHAAALAVNLVTGRLERLVACQPSSITTAYSCRLPSRCVRQQFKHLRHERLQIREGIAVGDQYYYRDIECRQVLLVLEFLIDGQEGVELANCKTEQVAVSCAGPTISGTVRASWPTSSRFNRRGRHSSSRMRTGEECVPGLFQARRWPVASRRSENPRGTPKEAVRLRDSR